MGLMDKFKNLFTDEEIIEDDEELDTVEIKEVKKEETVNKLPTFMREKIEQEEKKPNLKINDIDDEDDNNSGKEKTLELPNIEEKKSFKFPIDLEDNDFIETRSRQSLHQRKNKIENDKEIEKNVERTNIHKQVKQEPKVAEIYKDKKEEKIDSKPKFKATPIISPIYGILDKNYTPGDIAKSTGNNFEEKRPSKSVDFDSVRKKAYGNLSKDIKENLMCENCEYLKEAKECKKEKLKQKEYSREYSYEIFEETENNYNDLTLDEATENYYDYGVEYKKKSEPSYENINKKEIKISNFENEKQKREIPPVKSSINLLSTLKKSMGDNIEEPTPKKEENLELTDDLFNLIDSMYDERNENKW